MEMCLPPSIAQLRALQPPACPCLCPCSRQLPCGSTGPTPAQGLGPHFVRSPFASLGPSCIRLRGSELPEMGAQGLCLQVPACSWGPPGGSSPAPRRGKRWRVPFILRDVGWAALHPSRSPRHGPPRTGSGPAAELEGGCLTADDVTERRAAGLRAPPPPREMSC